MELNVSEKVATVKIPSSQLSLAIGKGGQNVRLAAKLTGWKIDIVGAEEPESVEEPKEIEKEETKPPENAQADIKKASEEKVDEESK